MNGGEFDWALDPEAPQYDKIGVCTSCILAVIMEAANMVGKDGITAVPINS